MPKPTHKRSAAFVPQLLLHLSQHAKFTCKFSSLPSSYQDQPYNLPAKLLARGGITANVVFNVKNDTFSIIRLGMTTLTITKKKPTKTKLHVR